LLACSPEESKGSVTVLGRTHVKLDYVCWSKIQTMKAAWYGAFKANVLAS